MNEHTNKFQMQVQVKGVTLTYAKGEKPLVSKTKEVQIVEPKESPAKVPIHYGTYFVGLYILLAFVALIGYVSRRSWKKKKNVSGFSAIAGPLLLIGLIYHIFRKKR